MNYVLTDYIERALRHAVYDKLEDGSYAGRIPPCRGIVAFAKTLRECEDELRSTLEDWVLLGLRLGHRLPIIDGISLNRKPRREPLASVQA